MKEGKNVKMRLLRKKMVVWFFLVLFLVSLLPFVDSATETYEITDDGAIKHLDVFPGDINNWEAVNDVDTANYVYWYAVAYDYDTYTMENHGIELGPINSVTIDARCLQAESPGAGDARIACRTHSTVYYDASFAVDNPPGVAMDDWVMAVNPNTGVAWTWDEVDAMEPGISLKGDTVNDKTQCYYITVEVDYDAELDPQTNDATLVEETTCMLNGVAYGDNGMTCGFWYNTSTTAPDDFGNNVTVPGVKVDSEPFNYEPLGLTSGDLYYVRAWALKAGVGFFNDTTEKNFMTKPGPPTNLNYTHHPSNITVNWTNVSRNDDVLQYTHIRWKVGSYPTSRTDGSLLYNGSNESAPLLNWQPETHYYFRSWTYVSEGGLWQFSDTTGDLDFISDDYANNLSVTWFNDTQVFLAWDKGINNTVLIVNETASPERPCNGTEIYNGSAQSYQHKGLTPSTRYYYGVWTINNGVGFSDGFSINDTYTLPTRPQSLAYLIWGGNSINISWTIGTGATHTVIRRNSTSQPLLPTDGTEVYNNTGTWYNMSGLDKMYYFTLFSYNSTTNLYSNASFLEWGALIIWSVRNESNITQSIEFDILITNYDYTQTYSAVDQNAPIFLDFTQVPYGPETIFVISNSSYKDRVAKYNIVANQVYNFSFLLPPHWTPVEEGNATTRLYVLRVIDEYDNLLENVQVTIERYYDDTKEWEHITTDFTGAMGGIEVYLIPDVLYGVELQKDEYTTKYEEWKPDPDFYGLNYPKYFKLYLNTTELVYSFGDICRFVGSWVSNGTMEIIYVDSLTETVDISFRIYEQYNGSLTWKETRSFTSDSSMTWYNTSSLNDSRMHVVMLEMNHTTLGYVINQSIYINPARSSGRVSGEWLENQFETSLGSFDFGWVNFFILFLPSALILLGLGAVHQPGLGIIGASAYLTVVTWQLQVNIETTLISIIGVGLMMGILWLIIELRGETT